MRLLNQASIATLNKFYVQLQQIRTREMHLQAEFGFAAHWRYKEGDCQHSSFVLRMVEWARYVVTWHCETMNKDSSSAQCADSLKPACKFPIHADDCPYCYKPHSGQDGPAFVIMIENDEVRDPALYILTSSSLFLPSTAIIAVANFSDFVNAWGNMSTLE